VHRGSFGSFSPVYTLGAPRDRAYRGDVTRTIALMRAREQAERTAARLAELGHACVIAPVTRVRATGAPAPLGPREAIVATSAKALDLLGAESLAAIADSPLFVIGARGAEAAARRGLATAAVAADVAGLTSQLLARLPRASHVLYLAGVDRRPELESALGAAGHDVAVIEIYAAEARAAWSSAEAAGVTRCDIALHYSRRGAQLALGLAETAGVAERFLGLTHLCLSRDAAEPLRNLGAPRVVWAMAPTEDALFAALLALN
jgi:uroporphyrinogen-III synthase